MTPLAEGGMAQIWLARHSGPKGFDRLVVIKRLIGALENDPDHVDMFLAEARYSAQLSHPHVVQMHDLGEDGDSMYLVMEYLDGENLSTVRRMGLKHDSPLLDHFAVRLISWAADGLHYAHTRVGVDGRPLGLVHRDISPQNLFATFDGGLKVLDFGVAKLAHQNTSSGKLKGKLGYMSPEQARGEVLDARSDLFSLGIVLFELVTRTRLFPSLDEAQVLGAIAHGKVPSPMERRPELDPALAQLISKAMAARKEDRFQSARELQDALEGWLTRKGFVVTTSDVADYLRALFARRIHDRRQLIDAALKAEMTPNAVANVRRLAEHANSSQLTSNSRLLAQLASRRMIPVAIAALVLIAIIVTSLVAAAGRPTPSPRLESKSTPPAPPVLVITSTPPGASLTVDGKSVGRSPVTLDTLSPGDHRIEAALEGHQLANRTVPLPKPGERLLVELALAPVPLPPPPPPQPDEPKNEPKPVKAKAMGKLTLKTTPWTTVFLGGRRLGDTPLVDVALPVGTHVLKLKNPDTGLDDSIEVEIKANQTTVKKLVF